MNQPSVAAAEIRTPDSEVPGIRWPAHYEPAQCPVHVRNQVDIAAPAENVWAWLIRAPQWPAWYINSKNVQLANGEGQLAAGTRFRWSTFGVRIDSGVQEFVAGRHLAWDAKALGIDAYHAWLITPTPTGCRVLTEETQHGLIARAGDVLFPGRMSRGHQVWLESLARQAMAGLPL